MQLLGRLHKNEPLILSLATAAPNHVGIDRQCPAHLRTDNHAHFRASVLEIHIARQNRLPIAHQVDVSRAALPRRQHRDLHAITGSGYGVRSAYQHLIFSGTRLQRYAIRGTISFVIVGVDAQNAVGVIARNSNYGNSGLVRLHSILGNSRAHYQVCFGRRSVRIRCQNEHFIIQAPHQLATFRNSRNQQRCLAYGDRLAARLRVLGRILHCGFHHDRRRTMALPVAGKKLRQHQIKAISPLAIRAPLCRCRFEKLRIHPRRLHRDRCIVHRLAKKVIRFHGAGDVIARPVIALRLAVFRIELDRHAELWQYIALNVHRQFGGARLA